MALWRGIVRMWGDDRLSQLFLSMGEMPWKGDVLLGDAADYSDLVQSIDHLLLTLSHQEVHDHVEGILRERRMVLLGSSLGKDIWQEVVEPFLDSAPAALDGKEKEEDGLVPVRLRGFIDGDYLPSSGTTYNDIRKAVAASSGIHPASLEMRLGCADGGFVKGWELVEPGGRAAIHVQQRSWQDKIATWPPRHPLVVFIREKMTCWFDEQDFPEIIGLVDRLLKTTRGAMPAAGRLDWKSSRADMVLEVLKAGAHEGMSATDILECLQTKLSPNALSKAQHCGNWHPLTWWRCTRRVATPVIGPLSAGYRKFVTIFSFNSH